MSFLIVFAAYFGGLCTYGASSRVHRQAEPLSASDCSRRRKPTTNMSDCGRRAPDRLLSSLAMWPQWAGVQFFHFTSFACHTERKRAADVWETAHTGTRMGGLQSLDSPIKSVRDEARFSACQKNSVKVINKIFYN